MLATSRAIPRGVTEGEAMGNDGSAYIILDTGGPRPRVGPEYSRE